MKTTQQCIPCFAGQALHIASVVTEDPVIQEQIIRESLKLLSTADYNLSPPHIAQIIHKKIREITNNQDPYKEIKTHFNRFVLGLYPALKKIAEESEDTFEKAVRLAIAGNVIDFGINNDLTEATVRQTIDQFLEKEIACNDLEKLRTAISNAGKIVYLGDNAGEIILDRLFIEFLPREKITYVVRGGPVINDVTMDDAVESGITDIVRVIDNGTNVPGTIPELSSQQFIDEFNSADLIIAKGQGNFETLNETKNKHIFFLFKVKCDTIAELSGHPHGSIIIKHHFLENQ